MMASSWGGVCVCVFGVWCFGEGGGGVEGSGGGGVV